MNIYPAYISKHNLNHENKNIKSAKRRLDSNFFSRRSHRRCSIKKGVFESFAIFTGKTPVLQPLFKQQLFQKRDPRRGVFSFGFARFLRKNLLRNTSG